MKHRLLRVNELVKRELSALITREIDFEPALVTISSVDVTPDLKNAHVFVSVLGAKSKSDVLEKLEAHRTILQADMAKSVVLVPHRTLSFTWTIRSSAARALSRSYRSSNPRSAVKAKSAAGRKLR